MKKLLCAAALVGMLAAPGVVRAQTTLGPVAALETDGGSTFGIGAYAGIAVPSLDEHLSINPSFIYFFPDAGTFWELNGDVVYQFEVSAETPVLPFALAGLNIAHASVGRLFEYGHQPQSRRRHRLSGRVDEPVRGRQVRAP